MKKGICKAFAVLISFVILISAALPAFAEEEQGTTYYVDNVAGSDENDGLSPETAWQTLAGATMHSYRPGDRLLFKAGQSFDGVFAANGSGSKEAPVTVSSYGEGARPLIYPYEAPFLFVLLNVSNWVIDGIDFTSPTGAGIYIFAYGGENTENITVKNCTFRNVSPGLDGTGNAAISLNTDESESVIRNIHLDSLKFFDVGWAIHTNGKNAEDDGEAFKSPDESYNSDFLFENIYIKNASYGGIVLSSVKDAVVRNCRLLDCATFDGFSPYAPLWMRHSTNVTVEYCEIAGAKNSRDGMAIDFDGWTTNSTYRYIYSHDNNRFIRNCVYDRETKNSGNSVYNCVSVNDNNKINHSATPLISDKKLSFSLMHDFSFYDNIVVNGSPIIWLGTPSANVHGLTFIGSPLNLLLHRLFNLFAFSEDTVYKTGTADDAAELINEITKKLPMAE